ncbi:MAG: hypothetical protein ACI9HA_003466 [Dinoroseobacter sp.]|jgi:hypothetical protein
MTTLSTNFDKAAIGISALCLVHCLLIPIALALLPSMALLATFGDETFHLLLVALIMPTSIIALTLGCKRHRSWQVLTLGTAGLAILILTALFAHDFLGEDLEKMSTVLGALLVAASHIQNFRLCRQKECSD